MVTYFDNNASTRVDPRVLERMLPLFSEQYGNSSSSHQFGAGVLLQIEAARQQVADLIGAAPGEIVFTSGGTEAVNAAIHGVLAAKTGRGEQSTGWKPVPQDHTGWKPVPQSITGWKPVPQQPGPHLIVTTVEHHAAREHAEHLAAHGCEITWLAVDRNGQPDLAQLQSAIRDDTALVVAMLANNETGIVLPWAEITRIAHEHGVPVFSDAVNALGKMAFDVNTLGVDLLSLSSHKVHGPKGAGALYLRKGTPFQPLIIGGPQEKHRRGGTHNAPGIVGFGAACAILAADGGNLRAHSQGLREQFEAGIATRFRSAQIIGAEGPRIANTSCVCFPGLSAESILMLLSEAGICASSGAACASGALEPSPILRAMEIPPEVARGQVRFSVSRFNTEAEVEHVLAVLQRVIEKVTQLGL